MLFFKLRVQVWFAKRVTNFGGVIMSIFRFFLIFFILAAFHPEKGYYLHPPYKPQGIVQLKETLLEKDEIEVSGFLNISEVSDTNGIYTLYQDKDFQFKGLGAIFGHYIFIELPDWVTKRPDYFHEVDIRALGALREMDCPGWMRTFEPCLVLQDISWLVLEEDYYEIFVPEGELVNLSHNYQIYFKIENHEKFLGLIHKFIGKVSLLIGKNDLEGISRLFNPDSQELALEELKTPGSYIRWFLFNDISDLPDYYKRKPPKSYGERMFKEAVAEKVVYLGNPAEEDKEIQYLTFCRRFDDGKGDWAEQPEFISGTFELDVACFNFGYSKGEVYFPQYLVEEYSP